MLRPFLGALPLPRGVEASFGRGVWASFLQNDVSRIRNQILPVSPRYNLSPLPGQEGEGGPDGSHGDWSKGFFIGLLE